MQRMGDIMHSTPVLFNYGTGNAHGSVVFVGTNEGYLHAIDADSGEEKFAFMPRELLINIKTLYDNNFNNSHPYGVDGPLTIWHDDANKNRIVDGSDKVYLYVGMRRGGKNYYALDVTDPSSPSLVWKIEGGTGNFTKLGQTWSKPVFAKIDHDGDKDTDTKDVLIFGGGYDVGQDDATNRQSDDEGGAIFIVDAEDGSRIWWADEYSTSASAASPMPNSIPADLRVIDIDGNGIHDRVYAADTGGRIYRIDLPDSENGIIPDDDKVTSPQVTRLADLSTDGSVENNRRFYSEPDTALVVDGRERYLAISIGSGYRAHPLNKAADNAQDRLYMLKDTDVYSIPSLSSLSTIQHGSDLVDLTDYTYVDGAGKDIPIPDWDKKNGWYINLNRGIGEKALASAFTLDNTVFFTTFQPESSTPTDACSSAAHTARAYVMNITNAKPKVTFTDTDADLTGRQADRSTNYSTNDIPTSVMVIAKKNPDKEGVVLHVMTGDGLSGSEGAGGAASCPGPNCLIDPKALNLLKVYWEEEK
jgi:type IV pilus assembly protein PilY1